MEEMKPRALEWIDERAEWLSSIAKDIWLHPELAMEEHYCSALVADTLEREGFVVERGVAGMPTAFVATWGSGSPTVGFLCEYDALPGLSNDTVAERKPLVEEGPGHGCGHNLIGAGTAGAGMAVRSVLAEKKLPGPVKVYGTPAEETLAGKVFMAREGIFDGMDACLTWHPSWFNEINYETCLALYSIKFTFRGQTCHIPSRPQDGKNAIDSVELMNVAANMRRKHLPPGMTFEYVVLRGGAFPNVVPDLAEVWYFVRAHEVGQVKAGVEELQNAARGAALALGTEVTWRTLTGCYPLLPNRTFSELLYENFQQVGPPQVSQEEQAFAEELRKSFEMREGEPLHTGLRFIGDRVGPFSQDAG
ncbi:MAG: amidohydrolase, partial [Acidobacteriota bacterium]